MFNMKYSLLSIVLLYTTVYEFTGESTGVYFTKRLEVTGTGATCTDRWVGGGQCAWACLTSGCRWFALMDRDGEEARCLQLAVTAHLPPGQWTLYYSKHSLKFQETNMIINNIIIIIIIIIIITIIIIKIHVYNVLNPNKRALYNKNHS